ncbi:MAG TPA: hypothetical protein VJ853_06800 [Thermoanaerobaculia bacterium]|nr:hypothetical protein [Thermoanaerobaculia bacterium]
MEIVEIVCALCSCHFRSDELDEDEILCKYCGHSLDDDHAAGETIEISIAEAS